MNQPEDYIRVWLAPMSRPYLTQILSVFIIQLQNYSLLCQLLQWSTWVRLLDASLKNWRSPSDMAMCTTNSVCFYINLKLWELVELSAKDVTCWIRSHSPFADAKQRFESSDLLANSSCMPKLFIQSPHKMSNRSKKARLKWETWPEILAKIVKDIENNVISYKEYQIFRKVNQNNNFHEWSTYCKYMRKGNLLVRIIFNNI